MLEMLFSNDYAYQIVCCEAVRSAIQATARPLVPCMCTCHINKYYLLTVLSLLTKLHGEIFVSLSVRPSAPWMRSIRAVDHLFMSHLHHSANVWLTGVKWKIGFSQYFRYHANGIAMPSHLWTGLIGIYKRFTEPSYSRRQWWVIYMTLLQCFTF